MKVPGSGLRKVVTTVDTPESTNESVVLQCDVEGGEEVARSEPVESFFPKMYAKSRELQEQESEGVCDEEEEVGVVVRASQVRARLTNFANDSAYWNTGARVRTRRCQAPKNYSEDVREAFVVDRTPVKRKHDEEITECGPVSESEVDEGSESDDSASSSSSSDASESEFEQSSRRATSNKRRRGGEETMQWTQDSLQLKFGPRRRSAPGRQGSVSSQQEETANCDSELKEMQLLLELQLKASERREAGMKQRMETIMDLMSRHMGHVEKRVSTLEVGAQPQEKLLERINVKLEKVMEGFSTLNENLSILSACLSRDLESQ